MKWKQKGHEFDATASIICNNNCDFIIWGAGTFGEAFCNSFNKEIKILSFIDSNVNKQGEMLCGLPIQSPNVLAKPSLIKILVSTGWTKDVFDYLNSKGYEHWKDYFHIDEFMTIYRMYHDKQLWISNLNINITEYCTLKCKKCSALNPYIKNRIHYSIEEIDKNLENYFRVVDKVSILGLCGGDAMAHPKFNEILSMIGNKYYKNKVDNIEIYSNAVILPKPDTMDLFEQYNIIYRFTDYRPYTDEIQKIEQLKTLLELRNIRYDHAKFQYWSDCGFPQKSNGIPIEDLADFYNSCDRRSCQGLYKNKLFYCGMALCAERADYCKTESNDYFLLETDKICKKELMEFALGYNEKGYLEYCKLCNGGPNINYNYVKAGIQLV